jgi:hypothetical protein
MIATLPTILTWLKSHPGIFTFRQEGEDLWLQESYSQKTLKIRAGEIERMEEKANATAPGETYLALLFDNGRQLALSLQGFAFPLDFVNTGPLPSPNPVYCLQDFNNLLNQLRHVGSEPERKGEAFNLILFLIALLDGAKAVGLDVDRETEEVDSILTELEKGHTLPPPHENP